MEIPAIAEMVEGTLDRMRTCPGAPWIDANLLKPTVEESLWVNLIGRGYPPPNRTFRWCTQRWYTPACRGMKIDPVNAFVKQRIGHWGEAILRLGARRAFRRNYHPDYGDFNLGFRVVGVSPGSRF